jgi:DedD protein
MDRRVKERLIGASILVVLIVLVVPELLSGPKQASAPSAKPALAAPLSPEPTRRVTVDLRTSKPPASAEDESADTPAAATAVTEAPAAAPAPLAAAAAPAAPSATPAPVESHKISPTSTATSSWSVQLGSFASRANADNLMRQLKSQGFAAFILTSGSGQTARYRVRVGPLEDRDSAERTAAKLKALKHISSIVTPGA